MTGFVQIKKQEIEDSLKGLTRQYLVGNLKKTQRLQHLPHKDIEVGITFYEEGSSEEAHKHMKATEFQYVLSGQTQYFDVDKDEQHEFVKGDFFAIMPKTTYAQKSKKGTRILFIKIPSINDKEIIPVGSTVEDWLKVKLRAVRKDFFFDENAPQPNSIKPATAVALIEDGSILMLQRRDSGKWTMPGGTLDFGESLTECAIRETKEECGLDVDIEGLIGTYSNPNILVSYSDGEVRQEFTIVYKAIIKGGELKIDDESIKFKWMPLDRITDLDMAESQKIRILDVINYQNKMSVYLR